MHFPKIFSAASGEIIDRLRKGYGMQRWYAALLSPWRVRWGRTSYAARGGTKGSGLHDAPLEVKLGMQKIHCHMPNFPKTAEFGWIRKPKIFRNRCTNPGEI